jgi:ribosomal protein L25 (general stress protein Ctc)
MKKSKMRRKSVVKITFKEKDKIKASPHEEVNRIMKIKIGGIEEKAKKYSAYLTEKPMHKIINFKK